MKSKLPSDLQTLSRSAKSGSTGIIALFEGDSSTDKTTAAEALADDLNLKLVRIDLSQVASESIGETEKNLRELFQRAEGEDWVLFFDEADALLGKRSEVQDSHDRYANPEVSFLLQKLEEYQGLAILATNQKSSIDRSLLKKIPHVLDFPSCGSKKDPCPGD